MKTLKEELQEIVDEQKLSNNINYICACLSDDNIPFFEEYKDMASNYAKEYFYGGGAWWNFSLMSEHEKQFIISEKYRFIKDLIAIL